MITIRSYLAKWRYKARNVSKSLLKKRSEFKYVQTCPNQASPGPARPVQTCPNLARLVQTCPDLARHVQACLVAGQARPDLPSGRPRVQDLSSGCPGRQILPEQIIFLVSLQNLYLLFWTESISFRPFNSGNIPLIYANESVLIIHLFVVDTGCTLKPRCKFAPTLFVKTKSIPCEDLREICLMDA